MSILLVATMTVLAAAVGPLYARAGGESILQDALRGAATRDVGVEVWRNAVSDGRPLEALDSRIDAAGPPTAHLPRIHSLQFNAAVRDQRTRHTRAVSLLVFREGACAHLVFVEGRCPTAAGESAVSARSQRDFRWRLGTSLPMVARFSGSGKVTTRVTGVYRPKNRAEAYWFDQDFFNAHFSADGPDVSDSIFTSRETFDRARLASRVVVQLPLDVRRVRLADEENLRRQVESFRLRVSVGHDINITAPLPLVFDAADNSRHRLEASVLIVAGQLLVLSWFVLYLVVANAAEARGPEIALAKLRGFTPTGTLLFGLLEPVVLICVAAPAGLVLGELAVGELARLRLLPGTPVLFTPLSAEVALGALAGGLVAAALAARRTLTRPVVEQLRRTTGEQPASRAGVYVDLAVAALALAGLLELRLTGALLDGHVNHLVLLAPGLVALAIALAGVRLMPVVCAAAVRRTRGSSRLGRFLALRQVVRRPTGLRLVVLLAVAFGLTTFAVSAWSVAAANRAARAATEVGAARVLTVEPAAGVDLVTAVRRLDPTGREAMATAEYLPFGGQPGGRLLAVDSSRLPAVATWRADFAGQPLLALARSLRPRVAPPVVLTGTELRVAVNATGLSGSRRTQLWVDVDSPDSGPQSALLGRIVPGSRTYVAELEHCLGGCRLVGLAVLGAPGDFTARSGELLFRDLEMSAGGRSPSRVVPAGLRDVSRWTRYSGSAPVAANDISATAAGLRLRYAATGGDIPGISPNDVPARLPAVLTARTLGSVPVGGQTEVTGLDGAAVGVTVTGLADVLPRAGADGTLVDLEYAGRLLGTRGNLSTPQVWLSAAAPADFSRRLAAAGIDVVSTETTAAHRATLGRQGPALALLLFLYAAGLAALLAAGGTVVSVFLAGRRRAFELAAMLAVGVPRRQLLRACVGEQLLLLMTAVALGTVAGFLGAVVALPSMPTFVDDLAVPPLHYAPDPAMVAGFLLAAVLAIAATGAVAALVLVRAASAARLREVQA